MEQANHAARTRSAIDPGSQGSCRRVARPGLKEPEEDVLVRRDIDIARIGLDGWVELADAGRDFFPADLVAGIACGSGEVRWKRHELRACKAGSVEYKSKGGEQHDAGWNDHGCFRRREWVRLVL